VVPIGLLCESLRGQSKLGSPGAASRDKLTAENQRGDKASQSVRPRAVHRPELQVDAVMLKKRLDRFESIHEPWSAESGANAGKPSTDCSAP
jgi:hypothetical protein